MTKKTKIVIGVVVAILILGIVGGLAGGKDEPTHEAREASAQTSEPAPSTTAATTTTAAPTTTAAEPKVEAVEVVEETAAPAPAPAAEPASTSAPSVIPFPISMAEKNNDIRIDAVDIGRHVLDDVNKERAIFDKANWRIVAQCDEMDGRTLKVGAIKNDEFAKIQQAGQAGIIAENGLKFTLECP